MKTIIGHCIQFAFFRLFYNLNFNGYYNSYKSYQTEIFLK